NVSKVIIPNPIGPLENEDRLVPFFVKTWRAGGTPSLRTPQLVRDNIPAQWLAKFYVDEVKINTLPPADAPRTRIRRPSGFALSNEAFLRLLIKNFEQRSGRSLPIEVSPQITDEPLHRLNLEQCPELKDPAAEKKFWDEWFSSLGAW
ncbi:MAG: hypothetical protein JST16_09720, partial [Bdellovibrionales bacterium]|nr:hypothetical protein [Bdellovibrionales bacterium]